MEESCNASKTNVIALQDPLHLWNHRNHEQSRAQQLLHCRGQGGRSVHDQEWCVVALCWLFGCGDRSCS
jgi:hypothetical protein